MRPSPALGIEDAVAVDDAMPLVFQEWECRTDRRGGPTAQIPEQLARLLVPIDADGEQLRIQTGTVDQETLQLNELRHAVRSPVAAIEHQHDRCVRLETRQGDGTPILVLQREVGGALPAG